MIWGKIAADRLTVIEARQKEIKALKQLVKALSEKIVRLEKNSTNSSRTPSSDILKPAEKGGEEGEKRKQGAQKGHKKHKRPPFLPEQIDKIIVAETRQQVELVTEHQYNRYWYKECQPYHTAQIAETDRNSWS
ncbi:MAG: DUF6444 domain-containing protein [Treponema sp.]|nr:DUF6444 domain-containing protein [Treponema sp.]